MITTSVSRTHNSVSVPPSHKQTSTFAFLPGEKCSHTRQKRMLFSVTSGQKWLYRGFWISLLPASHDSFSQCHRHVIVAALLAPVTAGSFRCWITRLCKFRQFAKTPLSLSQVRRSLPMHVRRLRPGAAAAGSRCGVRARLHRLPAGGSVLCPGGAVLRNHRRVPNAAQPGRRCSRSVTPDMNTWILSIVSLAVQFFPSVLLLTGT